MMTVFLERHIKMIYSDSYASGAYTCGNAEDHPNLLEKTPNATRKRSRTTELAEAIRNMCDVSRARLDRFNTFSSPSPRSGSADYTLAQCIALLEGMPDLDEDLYMKAIMKMMDNPQWREVFITFPLDKKMWLLEKLD